MPSDHTPSRGPKNARPHDRATPAGASGPPTHNPGGLIDDPDETVADMDVEDILDRPAETHDTLPGELDPEAGRGSIASKSMAVREAIGTPFGRLLLATPVALAGIALVIMAATHQTWPYIAAAAVIAPAGAWLVYRRYQDWLGHRRYIYRLLETLGEDVSEFDPDQVARPVKVKVRKRKRR